MSPWQTFEIQIVLAFFPSGPGSVLPGPHRGEYAQKALPVNGRRVEATPDDMGYVSLERRWRDGDVIAVALPMEVGRVVVFYENPRHAEDGWRYLEAAPCDQSTGAKWGCFRTEIPGARGTEVGTGRQNTLDIVAACDDPCAAAHLCASLVVNGVRGWFLPSRDELLLLYRNLAARGLGGFESGGAPDNVVYWTSSQISADMAGHVDLPDLGRVHFDDKDFPRRVRAIRAF